MSEHYNKIKSYYEGILKLTLEISTSIEGNKTDCLEELLNQKGKLITELTKIKSIAALSPKEDNALQNMVNRIKETEKDNISKLQQIKADLKKDMVGISKNRNVLSAYKVKCKIPKSRLIDVKE